MVFRRRRFGRRAIRAIKKGYRRVSKSHSGSTLMRLAAGAAYGAGRQYISNLVQPLTNMVPLGQYADEAVIGGLAYVAGRQFPRVKHITDTILVVEAARVGSQLMGNTTTSSAVKVYG